MCGEWVIFWYDAQHRYIYAKDDMRATLEEIEAELNVLSSWPTRIEKGALARDTRLIVDVSNCSAIGHLCVLTTVGNTLEVIYRDNGYPAIFGPIKDAKKVALQFIAYVNKIEGYGSHGEY